MLKKYRRTLVIGTLVMLLPVLAGLILWNRLPEQVPIHFNTAGEADGWGSRAFAVFALPGILLGLHWLCMLGSLLGDPKAENLQGKVFTLVLWICPILSVLLMALVYCSALGMDVNVEVIAPLLVGLLMVLIGNWLPKCRQTWTLGIKLPWTLADEENWNRTHRFAGPVWVACGLVIMACGLIGGAFLWGIVAVLVVAVAVPAAYSFLLYRGKVG